MVIGFLKAKVEEYSNFVSGREEVVIESNIEGKLGNGLDDGCYKKGKGRVIS